MNVKNNIGIHTYVGIYSFSLDLYNGSVYDPKRLNQTTGISPNFSSIKTLGVNYAK